MKGDNQNEFSGIIKGTPKINEKTNLKYSEKNKIEKLQRFDEEIDKLLNKLEHSALLVNRLDYYGNSIPLGAFCFAVPFILYGFYECKVFDKVDTFTFSTLLFFGGIGQITAGFFEYIKSRTFSTVVYLVYGLYFLSFFFATYYQEEFFNQNCKKLFYGTWAGLSFPLLIGSIRINIIFLLQNLVACAFFVIRCIGESKGWDVLNTTVSGILELVTGFLSLYLCFSQVLNEHYKKTIFPTFPLVKDNEIDFIPQNN